MFIMAHIIYCVNIGQYIKFVLSSRDWKKATGKDGKLIKRESSAAHQTVLTCTFQGRVQRHHPWREAQARGRGED